MLVRSDLFFISLSSSRLLWTVKIRCMFVDTNSSSNSVYLGIGAWNGIGTGIVGTIGYFVLPTGVSTDVSRDIV